MPTTNDALIDRIDLRFKLMQKNASRQAFSDDDDDDDDQRHGDLREKLTRKLQLPVPSVESRAQQHLPGPQGSGFFCRVASSRSAGILPQCPATRSTYDLPHMDSSINSYSPWTLDHIRRRSPERVQVPYRGLSPQRNVEDLQRRPLSRTYDGVMSVPYINKDVLDKPLRPVVTAPFMSSTAFLPGAAKQMAAIPTHMSQVPQLSSTVPKPAYMGDEQTVLQQLELGKYSIIFKAEEIDMTALKQMGENDLKELGIPMGPRKKLLLALLTSSKRPLATNIC